MVRPVSMLRHQALLDVIARFPDGVVMEQIEVILDAPPNRRTLQRWLNDLIAREQAYRVGHSRSVKYRYGKVIAATIHDTAKAGDMVHAEILIPLSSEAKEVEAKVRQPLVLRQPVGYNRAFLDSYRPNETYYLDQSLREELHLQGQAVRSQEPAGTYARHLANRLLIDLSWNSSRLEGNTYSLL